MSESPWLAVLPQCDACGRPMGSHRDLPPPTAPNPIKRGAAWCWRLVGIRCKSYFAKQKHDGRAKKARSTRRRKLRFFGPGF